MKNIMIKKLVPVFLGVISLTILSACEDKTEANVSNLTQGMNEYLAKNGDFCIGDTQWPIDVTQHEMDTRGHNAVQMPVMEKAGLVRSSIASVSMKDDDGNAVKDVKVMRYELTDEGRKYYLHQPGRKDANGTLKEIPGDFCAGRMTLDKIVSWGPVKEVDGQKHTIVTYTYNIDAADWAKKPELQKVFPMVAYVVNGGKKVQLKEGFVLTRQGWKSVDL